MSDVLLSIIVCFVLWTLINWIRSKIYRSKMNRANQNICQHEADYARTRSLFDLTRRKLEQKGLSDLMMTDYRFKTKVGSPKTTDVETLQLQLQNVLMEILSHLHLMPNVRLIVTKDPKGLDLDGAMGEYHDNYQDRQIRLLVDPKYTAEAVVAALCHESAHYFAYTCGIQDSDPDLNEGMTDTLTILLGFGDAVLQSNSNREIPYLNHPEFLELRNLLAAYRKEQKDRQAAALELETARKQLLKNMEGARGMLIQVRAMISVNKAPAPRKKYSRKNMETLQKTLLELESGAFEAALAGAEKASGGDLRTIRSADAEVLDICAKLYSLMLAFQ